MTDDSLWLTSAFSVAGVTSESCLLLGKVLMAEAGLQSEDEKATQTHSGDGTLGLTLQFAFPLSAPFTESKEVCQGIREDSLGRVF